MSGSSVKEISLGDGFGEVALKVNGATVEVHADGRIAAHTTGDVDAYTNASVRVHAAANDSKTASVEPKPGDRMPDGTIFAGISPDTHEAMYTTSADAKLTYTFNRAQRYAVALDANGHKDWRVPTKEELDVLFNNRAAIGGFDESGSDPAGWYLSSSEFGDDGAWVQRFSDGKPDHDFKFGDSSLRLVR